MRHRLYLHVVWTTRGRAPLLDAHLASFLDRFLRIIAREERALVLEIGMVRTHLHLLLRVHPMTIIPRLLQRLKGASSAVAGREHRASTQTSLKWERSYSIQSVGYRGLVSARTYVRNQAAHHPEDVIQGWAGGVSLSAAAEDEWLGSERRNLRAGDGSGELRAGARSRRRG